MSKWLGVSFQRVWEMKRGGGGVAMMKMAVTLQENEL